MRTDYRKPSEEIILDLINGYNSQYTSTFGIDKIHGKDVVIGVPYAINDEDTRITVTPKLTAPYIDPFSFTYRRVNLNELLRKNKDITFRTTEAGFLRVSEFIGKINERWGVNLGPNDYVDDGVFVVQGSYDTIMVVRANHNSLVWTGSIAIRLTTGVPLDSVIKITELDGFADRVFELDTTIVTRELSGFVPTK